MILNTALIIGVIVMSAANPIAALLAIDAANAEAANPNRNHHSGPLAALWLISITSLIACAFVLGQRL